MSKKNSEMPKEEQTPVTDPVVEPTADNSDQENEPELSVDEQIQQLMTENAKLKREKDNASSDAAKWKKQYQATLTDSQKAAQEKAERDAALEEEVKELRKKDKVNEMTASLLDRGFSKEKAQEAANAQYEGDWDTFNRLQSEHEQSLKKQWEQDWLKSRPQTNTGAGEGADDDPMLRGFESVWGKNK